MTLSDFFQSHEGTAKTFTKRRLPWLRLSDAISNVTLRLGGSMRQIRHRNQLNRQKKVLIVGISVPSRPNDIFTTVSDLCDGSRHLITVSITPMEDKGKFSNIETAIEDAPEILSNYDWLVIIDDDIAFELGRLDDMIAIATQADLALSQPAHAFASYTTYTITRRRYGVIARQTDFVEIGPLTLVRADLFDELIPFPPSRWCYGIDLVWSEAARKMGRRVGILDGTPIRHLRPVAGSYNMEAARIEGQALLEAKGITLSRTELFSRNEVLLRA